MGFKLSAPITETYPLEQTDTIYGTEGTTVTVRQATQAQHERRAKLFSTLVREYQDPNTSDDETVRVIQSFNLPELMRMEAFLTLVEANIEDEEGRMLFKPGLSENEFAKRWGVLPPTVAAEIHRCVLKVNKDWAPGGE